MMAEHGYPANTFTYSTILAACNFKGRGLFDVAAALYDKLLASDEAVPQDIQVELVKVRRIHVTLAQVVKVRCAT